MCSMYVFKAQSLRINIDQCHSLLSMHSRIFEHEKLRIGSPHSRCIAMFYKHLHKQMCSQINETRGAAGVENMQVQEVVN